MTTARADVASVSSADYVVVGGGSAGCVLANRLSADPSTRVVLIEAGGDDRPFGNLRQFRSNLMIHIPVGFAETMKDPKLNWGFMSEPVPGTDGRRHAVTRGRVLGGCSSINAMLYIRGDREDYDGWRQLGCAGWGWDDVVPYFRKAQNQERGPDDWHGTGGPLNVTEASDLLPVSAHVLAAAAAEGIAKIADFNAGSQDGGGRPQVTMRNGRRHSAAVAYLHPAMRRPNLKVLTSAVATRVLFDGRTAVGVEYSRGGALSSVTARREVILAGGAINSPQLLELSGVGDGDRLAGLGIPVLADRPAVGENLQDHYMSVLSYHLKSGTRSINELTRGRRFLGELVKYATRRRGLLAESAVQLFLYARSRPELATPDLQFAVTPATMKPPAEGDRRMVANDEPGLSFAPCHLRPQSRGWIHIHSPDPMVAPAIQPNYLAERADQLAQIAGVRIIRAIADREPLASDIDREFAPGPAVESDDEILAYVRATGSTVYHPVGTVRMGSDPAAVVDLSLRVNGVERLRVVDASVMPRLVSGNTNAPTIMIAEKASDMILRR